MVYSGEFTTLTPDEVRLCASKMNEQDAASVITAAFAGLRKGEVLALRWQDVDFPNERVQVRHSLADGKLKAPKSGKVRSAPMIPEVVAALDGLSKRGYLTEPEDPVFPNAEGDHGGGLGLLRRFHRALG